MQNIKLQSVSSKHPDFILLSSELDAFLNIAIGGESKREKYKQFNQLDTMDYILVAYNEEFPIGCSALRQYSENEIELKRVFVRAKYRNQHIASQMMEYLISHAQTLGFSRMLLETGEFLKASVNLYKQLGFEVIENYGAYTNIQESLCMARVLSKNSIIYCENRKINAESIHQLFSSVNWLSANYADRLSIAFGQAGTVISAWQNNTLVGLAEVLDDGELNAYIHYLLVHPDFQKQGIATHMINLIKQKYKNYLYLIVICERPDTLPFYEKTGFTKAAGAVPLQIQSL